MKSLRMTLGLLDRRDRRHALLMCVAVTVVAGFEILSVVSVMPFLGVLMDPDIAARTPLLAAAARRLGLETQQEILIALGGLCFALLVAAAAVRAAGIFLLVRFVQRLWRSLASRLLEVYLRQPYTFFINRNSSDLSKKILAECQQISQGAFMQVARILEFGATFLAMIALLVLADPQAALIAALCFASVYALIFRLVRRLLSRIGAARVQAGQDTFRITAEAFGAIKEVKLRGEERAYLDGFSAPTQELARYTTQMVVVGRLPKYLVELIAFGGILIFALYTISSAGQDGAEMTQAVQILGLYAFASYRLLPAAQALYEAFAQLRYTSPAIEALLADLAEAEALPGIAEGPPPAPLAGTLRLEDVRFRYPGSEDRQGLEGISLEIPEGTSLGIVGTTGAGKTTLVDLLLGILRPTGGRILVGDVPLEDEAMRRRWQAGLAYVPQDVFLFDATIAANIAFRTRPEEIPMDRVRQAAALAGIAGFIETETPQGYLTGIGEHGARLSGGQRQRLGIARALCRQPKVLVLDEATSALDNATEREVLSGIRNLHGTVTVIQIAHRLSTVVGCDEIVVLDKGRLVGRGTYAALLETSEVFRALALAD